MFRIGLSRDFLRDDGSLAFGDIGLDTLEAEPDLEWEFLPEKADPLRPSDIEPYDALLLLAPRVTEETLKGSDRLKIIARFGVGYDNVDVEACTRAGIVLTITPDAVRRPVASSALALILALAHRITVKDRLTREGRWSSRVDYMGQGLAGRTLGIIGFGNIGREIARLAAPFDLRIMACDPAPPPPPAAAGVVMVDLDELMATADYVCVCCPLTPETHHLINAQRLALMKPSASLINVARGPIVDQRALADSLASGSIWGAALDVFEVEPIPPSDPLLSMENVILSPHSVAWTDQLFRDNGRSAIRSIASFMAGQSPDYVVNRAVLADPRVLVRLTGLSGGTKGAAR